MRKTKKELEQELEHSDEVANHYMDRAMYYRNEIGWLIQAAPSLSHEALVEALKTINWAPNDPDVCFDNCKSMYFCSKPKGHDGLHSNGPLCWD